MDADAFREDSRRKWEEAASGWERRREVFQRATQPVSMWLVEHARLQPGHQVVELAGGTGETGLLAAEVVQPGGRVLLTDGAEAMVEAASRRAAALGITNVEARRMDAEWIDLPTASVDAVLCRWGFMLLADPAAALRETRRVLRSGGRVTLAAWADDEHNPWMTSITETIVELGYAPPAPPDAPGPMTWAEPGVIQAALEDAGFDDVEVSTVDFTFSFPSTDAHFEHQADMSTRIGAAINGLSPADHYRLREAVDTRLEQFAGADGSLELPARTWVAAASA